MTLNPFGARRRVPAASEPVPTNAAFEDGSGSCSDADVDEEGEVLPHDGTYGAANRTNEGAFVNSGIPPGIEGDVDHSGSDIMIMRGSPPTAVPSSSRGGRGGFIGCCFTILRFVNTFAVAILVAAVIMLFLQVQFLTRNMSQQQTELASLELKLQNQTTTQIQELSEKVDQEQNLTLYQMAGTFALLTSLLTMFHMSSHLRNFYNPPVQRKIVAILWLSPIYAVTSFLSLVFPSADGYLAVIKDFYEAYAIFVFLSFLIAVLGKGDRQVAVQNLAAHADHLKRPNRCLRSCYHPPPETSDEAYANAVLTECQILCMQFVFVRPITSIATFVCNVLMVQYQSPQRQDQLSHPSSSSQAAVDLFESPQFYIAMVRVP